MLNFNGTIIAHLPEAVSTNRAFLYGDAIFETIRIVNGKVLFLEDHYFRLMASLRIVRMQIPDFFTLEYFEEQIIATCNANTVKETAYVVRGTFFRNGKGKYTPNERSISFCLQCEPLQENSYEYQTNDYEVTLFNDYTIGRNLLSTLKTTNKILQVTASIFAEENGYKNCILLNDSKNVAEFINGNIFLFKDKIIKTPPLTEGCVNGIIRKNLLKNKTAIQGYTIEEAIITPFELQNADALCLTNIVAGVVGITQYRKKTYNKELGLLLHERLKEMC